MNKKHLAIGAAVIAIAAITALLWPDEQPAPVAPPPAAVHVAPESRTAETQQAPAEEEKKTMRVTFINHLGDAHIKFTVDDAAVCTANAGQACYGDVAYGKHIVKALDGEKVVRTLDFTLNKENADPKVIVCIPGAPDC